MEKKKVVSREFKKEFKNDKGTFYSFLIKFEGDDNVYGYTSSKNPPPYFNVGEEQEHTVEVKDYTKKDGTPASFKVVKPFVPQKPFGGGGYQKYEYKPEDEKHKQKVSSVAYCLSYAKDLAVAGKITSDTVKGLAQEWIAFMHSEIDKL